MPITRKTGEESMKNFRRTHPYTILKKLKISAILLVLPVVRQILYRPQNIFEIISSLSLSTLYAILLIIYAIYSYRRYAYGITSEGICIKEGLLIKKVFTIPFDKIWTISFRTEFAATLFGAIRVSFDTPGGPGNSYDISGYFSGRNGRRILESIHGKGKELEYYKANFVNTLLTCAFWANPASGLLFVAPLISGTGNVFGTELTESIIGRTIDFRVEFIAKWMSPAAGAVASILLLGWALSMLTGFMRYSRFRVFRKGEFIGISRGMINKSIIYTLKKGIVAVSVDQSLLMRILGLYSAGIFTIGSGKLKYEKSMIVAPESKEKVYRVLEKTLGLTQEERKCVHTPDKTLKSYLYLPLFVSVLTISSIYAADYFIIFNKLFRALLLFSLVPLAWWIFFRIYAHRHAHLGITKTHLIVCGYKGLTLKKYFIPFDKIQQITITQSIPQRMNGNCNVRVYLYFEKQAYHTVKHLPLDQVRKLLAEQGLSSRKY